MKAFEHPMHLHLRTNTDYVGEATFQGKLYQVNWYPAVVSSMSTNDLVYGELYRVNNPEDLWPKLDKYEDADDGGEYHRSIVDVMRDGKTPIKAWTYLFNREISCYPYILSGRFKTDPF